MPTFASIWGGLMGWLSCTCFLMFLFEQAEKTRLSKRRPSVALLQDFGNTQLVDAGWFWGKLHPKLLEHIGTMDYYRWFLASKSITRTWRMHQWLQHPARRKSLWLGVPRTDITGTTLGVSHVTIHVIILLIVTWHTMFVSFISFILLFPTVN